MGGRELTASGEAFPETWPGLQPQLSEVPAVSTELTETLSGMQATETWFYSDRFVHPERRTTRRTTCLHFVDERLAEWSFGYGKSCADGEATPGGEMVFDPLLQAYRVLLCPPSANGDRCAHYYHAGTFYRQDADGCEHCRRFDG